MRHCLPGVVMLLTLLIQKSHPLEPAQYDGTALAQYDGTAAARWWDGGNPRATTTEPPACVAARSGGRCTAAVCCVVCAAAADCTAEIQAALDSPAAHTIVFAARTWVTQPLRLTRNNSHLIFAPGAVVLSKQGSFRGIADSLFSAYVTSNLTISGYGATWRMRRAEYNNNKLYHHSEGRHGLCLMGCRNTIVEGLRIELTGGDGISAWKGHAFDHANPGDHGDDYCPPALALNNPACACVNLLVRDVVCDRNYRQGMSVMLAENLLVENSTFSNTAGTPPAAGLDIEPDHPNYRFVNVTFRGCSFLGNRGGGIGITTARMDATSPPISISFEDTTIVGGSELQCKCQFFLEFSIENAEIMENCP